MKIQDCEHQNGVLVRVDPHELDCGYGKTVPFAFAVGVVLHSGDIDVWTPYVSVPRGYKRAAQRMLESVRRSGLWPDRYACTYSGSEEVYRRMTFDQRARVDSVAKKWADDDVSDWERHWRTKIDQETKSLLVDRARSDSIETKARTLRYASLLHQQGGHDQAGHQDR